MEVQRRLTLRQQPELQDGGEPHERFPDKMEIISAPALRKDNEVLDHWDSRCWEISAAHRALPDFAVQHFATWRALRVGAAVCVDASVRAIANEPSLVNGRLTQQSNGADGEGGVIVRQHGVRLRGELL